MGTTELGLPIHDGIFEGDQGLKSLRETVVGLYVGQALQAHGIIDLASSGDSSAPTLDDYLREYRNRLALYAEKLPLAKNEIFHPKFEANTDALINTEQARRLALAARIVGDHVQRPTLRRTPLPRVDPSFRTIFEFVGPRVTRQISDESYQIKGWLDLISHR